MSRRPSRNNSTRSSPLPSTANVAANDEYSHSGASAAAVAEGERKRKRESIKNKKNNNDDDNNTPFNGRQQSAQKRKTNSSSSFVNNDENVQNGVSSIAISPSRLRSCASTVSAPTTTAQTKGPTAAPTAPTAAPTTSSSSTDKLVFKDKEALISLFIGDRDMATTLKELLKSDTTHAFAAPLRDRIKAILGTTQSTDAQKFLNDAHITRNEMAKPINNTTRKEGRCKGVKYKANLGMLPKTKEAVLAVIAYYVANYATLDCAKFFDGLDVNNAVDIVSNPSMAMLLRGLPTMIVNEYNNNIDIESHDLTAVKNDNAERTIVSDINPVCLDKGTYKGAWRADLNRCVREMGLDEVLPVNKNQATKVGRLILQLGGLLGHIENVVAKWLATVFGETVDTMVLGSNALALIGKEGNDLLSRERLIHPEMYCGGSAYLGSDNYTDDKLRRLDAILKKWYIGRLQIINIPYDFKQAMMERLNLHEVTVTYRFGHNELGEHEKKLISGGKYKRINAFTSSESTGCIFLFNADNNVVYTIGNKQTPRQLRSSMWNNKPIARGHFHLLILSDEVNSNISSLEDGLDMQDKLNEQLEALAEKDVEERLAALSEYGVVGFKKPESESVRTKHMSELESIAAKEENWVSTGTQDGDTKVLVISGKNATPALYTYVRKFLDMPIDRLREEDCWEDIQEFNWHHHSKAKNKDVQKLDAKQILIERIQKMKAEKKKGRCE